MPIKTDKYCPNCLTTLDCDTKVNGTGGTPSPGDIALCAYCGHVLIYTKALRFREVTEKNWAIIPNKTKHELSKSIRALQKMHQEETSSLVKHAKWN